MYKMIYIDDAVKHFIQSIINEYMIDPREEVICEAISGKDLDLPSNEYVLIRGSEILLTCKFKGEAGQVFTVSPKGYKGKVKDIINLDLSSIYYRSIFYAFSNALLKSLGLINKSIHCEKDDPIKCSKLLVEYLIEKYGSSKKVLHIGYQPGHVSELYKFYRENLLITDLRSDTVWRIKNHRLVYDGLFNNIYIGVSDIVLVTASSITNSSFWSILSQAYLMGKHMIMYGVSAGAVYYFINKYTPYKIELFCPLSK